MQINFAQGCLLLISPIAPLLVSTPSLAATIGSSEATVNINNFSHNPDDVLTLSDTFTDTFATNGQVNTDVDAVANFFTKAPSANNSSFSRVDGNGSEYFGSAESIAGVIGYDFSLKPGETFSFDFDAALNLATSIDNPQLEAANAQGTITFKLYDTTNQDNWLDLDYFTLSGNLTSSGNNDYLNYDNSDSISLNQSGIIDNHFGGERESANASVQGSFSRTFDNSINLTLVEVKNNQASVSVPEPSSFLGLLLGVISMGYKITSKVVSSRYCRH